MWFYKYYHIRILTATPLIPGKGRKSSIPAPEEPVRVLLSWKSGRRDAEAFALRDSYVHVDWRAEAEKLFNTEEFKVGPTIQFERRICVKVVVSNNIQGVKTKHPFA